MKKIRVCVEYNNQDPIYKDFEGWLCSTEGITEYSELPKKAKEYIEFIEKFIECTASIISTGPSRNQTISR
jgi:adenylosuccinate synthase